MCVFRHGKSKHRSQARSQDRLDGVERVSNTEEMNFFLTFWSLLICLCLHKVCTTLPSPPENTNRRKAKMQLILKKNINDQISIT